VNQPTQRVGRASGATFRVVGDEVVIAPPERDDFEVLSGTSVAVWELIEIPLTVPELSEVLASRFGAEAEVVERDVRELIDRLRSRGCVEVEDG
jgi:coenzyme PQQ synthesis protein D (PqqD)